jgi:hypothetical protein
VGRSLIVLYRFRITISEYGAAEAHAERVLEAFYAKHPDVGAVVSQNTRDRTLTVVFSLDAEDSRVAIERGQAVFRDGGEATGLPMTELIEANVSLVPAEELAERDDDSRELQPA